MKKFIELHDSVIDSVTFKENCLTLMFDPMIVLHVTDAFGFEFNNTEYLKGSVKISNPSIQDLSNGQLFDGYLQIEECRYPLIPENITSQKKCVLFISKSEGDFLIFGDGIEFSTI